MQEELRVIPGTLLAAWPNLEDPNFRRAVVLMCHHNQEGAYGLVVNRAAPLTVSDLLPEHPTLSAARFPVHVGGPVEPRALQFVHTEPDAIPGGISLDGRLWLGGDLDALGDLIATQPERAGGGVRLFLGYAGWAAHQLEGELDGRSWLPAPLALDAVFGRPDEDTWRRVVRSVGDVGEGLLNEPPDPSWN
jgi:putative transcriptional regulator